MAKQQEQLSREHEVQSRQLGLLVRPRHPGAPQVLAAPPVLCEMLQSGPPLAPLPSTPDSLPYCLASRLPGGISQRPALLRKGGSSLPGLGRKGTVAGWLGFGTIGPRLCLWSSSRSGGDVEVGSQL